MTGGSYSIPEVKALLRVLAAGRRAAEAGTSFGDGAAAIAETAVSLVAVEVDPERAAVARETLAGLPNVRVFEGDWRDVLRAHAPFGFLFFDAGGIADTALQLLEPGGVLLKDDARLLDRGRPRTGVAPRRSEARNGRAAADRGDERHRGR